AAWAPRTGLWPNAGTGVFAHRRSYGVQAIQDGTSNTIAFSEALIPPPAYTQFIKWRTGASGTQYPHNTGGLADARSNMSKTMSDLQICTDWFQARRLGGFDKCFRWSVGGLGLSCFNTIVPPNSQQYQWAACRMDQAGGTAWGTFHNATSNHPGGCNFAFADGSVKFIKPGFPRCALTSSSGTSAGSPEHALDTGRIPVSKEKRRDSKRSARWRPVRGSRRPTSARPSARRPHHPADHTHPALLQRNLILPHRMNY